MQVDDENAVVLIDKSYTSHRIYDRDRFSTKSGSQIHSTSFRRCYRNKLYYYCKGPFRKLYIHQALEDSALFLSRS